jgi:hypothetical protein
MSARAGACGAAVLCLALACGPANPVDGDWELDRGETGTGAVAAVVATDLATLHFDRDGATSGDTKIPGTWVVEEGVVRLVRADGRGEHRIVVRSEDRIEVELPIGVTAVYRRAGKG